MHDIQFIEPQRKDMGAVYGYKHIGNYDHLIGGKPIISRAYLSLAFSDRGNDNVSLLQSKEKRAVLPCRWALLKNE